MLPERRTQRTAAPPRFVADCMVGRLAKWLRAFGFDVTYHPSADDERLIHWTQEREAILVTRDIRLARRARVEMIFIQHDRLEDQLRQVFGECRIHLSQASPLSRCTVCNETLSCIAREEVKERVPPYVYQTQKSFALCSGCGRIYWQGTHAKRIRQLLARLTQLTCRPSSRAAGPEKP